MLRIARILSLTLLLALTGCSKCGAGNAPAGTPAAVSAKDQYIAKVDDLCRSFDDNSAKAIEKLAKPTNPEEALKWSTDLLNISLDSQEALAKEIQKITPPSEDSALLQQILQEDGKRMEAARAAGKALQSEITKDQIKNQQDNLTAMAKRIDEMAKKYGFKFCFLVEEKAQ